MAEVAMIYRVQAEDRLSTIAALHGVDVASVIRANPAKPRARLPSGTVVFASLDAGEDLSIPIGLGIASPASVNCANKGGELRIESGPGGSDVFCRFKDGTECEEWALFRGECSPPAPSKTSPWIGMAIALGVGLVVGAGAMHLSMKDG